MKRLLLAVGIGLALGLALAVQTVLADNSLPHTGRVVISTQGDVVIPAGDHADAVLVVQGRAEIRGEVNTIVVVDGSAMLLGARAESVVAIRSQVEVGPDTVISDRVMRLDSTVHQTGNAEIAGGVTDLAPAILNAGAILAPALFLIWIGFGIAAIVAAVFVAALAGRQLREAERLLAAQPLRTFMIGLGAVIALPILAVLLMLTVIGAPLGIGILIGLLPVLAFAGYMVAATWIGGWIVRETTVVTDEPIERPFLPVVAGVLVLTFLGLIPVLTIAVAIVSLVGFGAIVRLGIHTLRGEPRPAAGAPRPVIAPTGA